MDAPRRYSVRALVSPARALNDLFHSNVVLEVIEHILKYFLTSVRDFLVLLFIVLGVQWLSR